MRTRRFPAMLLLSAGLVAGQLDGQISDAEARARALYAQDELAAAAEAYLELAANTPADVAAAQFAARAAWIHHQENALGERDEALRAALRRDPSIRLDETAHDATFLQKLEEVRIEIEAERSLTLQNLVGRAGAAQSAGRWAESAQLYGELLEIEPANVPARLRHALTLINAGSPGAADATLEMLRQSIETLDPEVQREVRFLGAMARIRSGRLDGVEPVIQRMPADRQRQLWLALADQHQRSESWEAAIETFGRVLEMTPDDRQTAIYRARLLGQLGRWSEAESSLINLSETLPRSAAVWNELGRVRLRLSDRPGALAAFRRAADLSEGDETDQIARAAALVATADALRSDDPDAAKQALDRATAIAPNDPDVLAMQSRLATDRGAHEQAIGFAQRALQAAPGRVDLRNLSGNAYYQAGRMDEAIQVFESLLADEPGLDAARENLELARRANQGPRETPSQPARSDAPRQAEVAPTLVVNPSPREPASEPSATSTAPSPDTSNLPIGLEVVVHRWERAGRNVLRVQSVDPSSKANRCGIQQGDLLIRLESQLLDAPDELLKMLGGQTSGLRFDIVREGEPRTLVCV